MIAGKTAISAGFVKFLVILFVYVAGQCGCVRAQIADSTDFVRIIEQDTAWVRALGLSKLTTVEKQSLNLLLRTIYNVGYNGGLRRDSANVQTQKQPTAAGVPSQYSYQGSAYLTKIEDDNGDVLHLANGAIVEITSGYLGYVGYGKDAVLFKTSYNWNIWIEGKKAFKCDVLKEPQYGTKYSAEELTLSEVKGDGSILIMLDGSIFEVNSLYTIDTSLWLPISDLILIDDYQLINLDDGDEIVEVTRIK